MVLTPRRLRLLIASLFAVSFLGALDHTVVSTSLATIAGDLGGLESLALIVVGYTLASTVLLPVIGRLGDALGPRRVFLVSLVLFVVASLACGFAQDMPQLIGARVVQGMSSAGLQLMSQTIVARVMTPRQRPRSLAVIGAAFPVAIVIGPVVGGLLTDYWGWPWVFWINVPVGLVAIVFAAVVIPPLAPAGGRRFDYAGAATFTVALVSVVLAVTWIGTVAAAVAFAVAVVGFALFAWVELRAPEPLIPLSMFRLRAFSAGVGLSAVVGIGLFAVTSFLPTYLQMSYGVTATVSGLVPIATVLGMLASNLLTGWLASRTGHYRPYPIVGTAVAAVALAGMALLPVGLPLWVPAVLMALVGLGTGAFQSLVVAVAQSAVPAREVGAATAAVNLVRQVGSTIAVAVIGTVVGTGVAALLPAGLDASTLTPQAVLGADAATRATVAALYHDVFAPVFTAMAVVYALGVVIALLLPAGRLSDRMEERPVVEPEPAPV